MSTWYYFDNDGQKQGPYNGGQLKWLAKNGKITPETIVETEDGKKAQARKITGLTFVETSRNETTTLAPTQSVPNVQVPTEPNPFTNTPQLQTQEEKPFTMAEQKMIGDFCTRFFPIFGHGVQNVNASRETLLHAAVKEGKLTIIRYLVTQGADVNAMNNYEQSPLYFAARLGYIEIIKFLVSKGADIDAKKLVLAPLKGTSGNYTGYNEGKILETVEFLISQGVDINAGDEYGSTVLLWAAGCCSIETVKVLVSYGANVNVKDNEGISPILQASRNQDVNVANFFIAQGADTGNVDGDTGDGFTALDNAIKYDNIELVKYLVSHGANVNGAYVNTIRKYGISPLYKAIEKKNFELAELLVSKGADVNAKYLEEPLLFYAVRTNNVEFVRLLISHGANVNGTKKYGTSPLYDTIGMKNLEIAKLLVSKGSNVNCRADNGETPLYVAAVYARNVEFVNFFLASGADVNAGSKYIGNSIFHEVVLRGDVEIAKLFVSYGINVNLRDSRGNTPLDNARKEKKESMTQFLYSVGAKSGQGCAAPAAAFIITAMLYLLYSCIS